MVELQEWEPRVKKWDHLPVRPTTFQQFREVKSLRELNSDDALVLELLHVYKKRLSFLEKKRLEARQ